MSFVSEGVSAGEPFGLYSSVPPVTTQNESWFLFAQSIHQPDMENTGFDPYNALSTERYNLTLQTPAQPGLHIPSPRLSSIHFATPRISASSSPSGSRQGTCVDLERACKGRIAISRPKPSICPHCQASFVAGRRHNCRRRQAFVCDLCSKSFATKPNLERHRKTARACQSSTDQRFACVCDKLFSRRDVMLRHVRDSNRISSGKAHRPL